jgi:hypothetical protein
MLQRLNEVVPKCYDMVNKKEIEQQYDRIKSCDTCVPPINAMTHMKISLECKKQIEMLKVPTFVEYAKKYMNDNKSVVIYVEFNETSLALGQELQTDSLIYTRQQNIAKIVQDFQNDHNHIIICTYNMVGRGISLNDTHGNYPRVTLMSLVSLCNHTQLLARVVRAGTKSDVLQLIMYCSDCEEYFYEKMKKRFDDEEQCEKLKDIIKGAACNTDLFYKLT